MSDLSLEELERQVELRLTELEHALKAHVLEHHEKIKDVITPDTAKIIDDIALVFWLKSKWDLRYDRARGTREKSE